MVEKQIQKFLSNILLWKGLRNELYVLQADRYVKVDAGVRKKRNEELGFEEWKGRYEITCRKDGGKHNKWEQRGSEENERKVKYD